MLTLLSRRLPGMLRAVLVLSWHIPAHSTHSSPTSTQSNYMAVMLQQPSDWLRHQRQYLHIWSHKSQWPDHQMFVVFSHFFWLNYVFLTNHLFLLGDTKLRNSLPHIKMVQQENIFQLAWPYPQLNSLTRHLGPLLLLHFEFCLSILVHV